MKEDKKMGIKANQTYQESFYKASLLNVEAWRSSMMGNAPAAVIASWIAYNQFITGVFAYFRD
jgi:hypothetical protein